VLALRIPHSSYSQQEIKAHPRLTLKKRAPKPNMNQVMRRLACSVKDQCVRPVGVFLAMIQRRGRFICILYALFKGLVKLGNFLLKNCASRTATLCQGLLILVQTVNMCMRSFYLPEWHDFAHISRIPWPDLGRDQLDWVSSVEHMESWLNRNIGQHWTSWAWANANSSWEMAVAFRWDRDQCLFLLRWSR
jgi:hypothetical protein